MIGFEAISSNNGWAMAATGATIVLCGLAILAFAISLLPKILLLFEKKTAKEISLSDDRTTSEGPDLANADITTLIKRYAPLIEELGPLFQLSELYALSKKKGLPHAHLTIKRLREEGILISDGKGQFIWKT